MASKNFLLLSLFLLFIVCLTVFLLDIIELANPPNNEPKIIIIGAGVTGLCAARRLEELGYENYMIIDQSRKAGGLASTIVDKQGFRWDLGVHVLFSHFEFFDLLLDEAIPPKQWYYHARKSPAYMRDRFVNYPVQDNLADFPREEALKIIKDLEATREDRMKCGPATGRANFADWMDYCFGSALTEAFGRPYNFKVWATRAENMNSRWVGERVATIDVDDVVRRFNANQTSKPWGPNALFRYPMNGTGAIWQSVYDSLPRSRFRFGATVTGIDLDNKRIVVNNNSDSVSYDSIISTMPMDRLLNLVPPPETLASALVDGFVRQTCNLVGIGVGQCKMPSSLNGVHWIYFPENDYPFYRVTVMTNLSPKLAPNETYWSLLTETSESDVKPINVDTLIDKVIDGLKKAKLLPNECEIISKWQQREVYGYPVPYFERDNHVHALDSFLLPLNIHSRGRFGGWKYEVANQDHSCGQGVDAVNNILFGDPETVWRMPGATNSRYNLHAPLAVGQHFSTEAKALRRLKRWVMVVARCHEDNVGDVLSDWARTVVPDNVRFSILIYEYCQEPIEWSLNENSDHIAHVALPSHIDSPELAFAYHIQLTKNTKPSHRQLTDITLFASATALVDSSLAVWMRCSRMLPALFEAMPDFGVLATDVHPHVATPSPQLCAALNSLQGRAMCPASLATCVGPVDLFWTSGHRLMTAKLPAVPQNRVETVALESRDWRQLWHMAFGLAPELAPKHCVSRLLTAAANNSNDACPNDDAILDAMRVGARPGAKSGEHRRTLLITGGLGNIGLTLLRSLLVDPYVSPTEAEKAPLPSSFRVVIVDNSKRPLPKDLIRFVNDKRLFIHRFDMLDEDQLQTVFDDNKSDMLGVIHLAAVSRVSTCERNTTRCLAVNMRATELLTSVMTNTFPEHYKAPFLIFTSSREVFGDTQDNVVDENSIQNPLNVYGTSKAFAETHVRRFADHGYRCVILRLSNVYGSWEDLLERVTPNFVCRAMANRPLQVVGGNQQLALIHIDDIVRGIELALAHAAQQRADAYVEIAHLAAPVKPIGIVQWARQIIQATNSTADVAIIDSDGISVDNYNTFVDKAEMLLGFRARVSREEGLQKFIASYPFKKGEMCPVLRGQRGV